MAIKKSIIKDFKNKDLENIKKEIIFMWENKNKYLLNIIGVAHKQSNKSGTLSLYLIFELMDTDLYKLMFKN